ncbi:MAG: alpha/beta hydrolase [Firmicutes bacterium]|nr:alpha/beta hydrolase [Candidatus Fiminaster equi]
MNSKITTGHLDIVELPFLGTKRIVRIWTPDDYNKDKKYSVIYMHDGQNIFNYFDKSMEMWNLNEIVRDSIVVGVDHGGVKRIDELSPRAWTKYGKNASYVRKPCGEEYCDFLINKVMPYVNKNYNVKQGREFTSIGGSSMGGIMSLYIALTYKEIFGKAYVFSPAFKVYSAGFFEKYLQENPIILENLPYLYIASGGTHGAERKGSGGDESIIAKYVPYIKVELTKRGYPRNKIKTQILEGWVHHECTWRELFPSGYNWLENSFNIKA